VRGGTSAPSVDSIQEFLPRYRIPFILIEISKQPGAEDSALLRVAELEELEHHLQEFLVVDSTEGTTASKEEEHVMRQGIAKGGRILWQQLCVCQLDVIHPLSKRPGVILPGSSEDDINDMDHPTLSLALTLTLSTGPTPPHYNYCSMGRIVTGMPEKAIAPLTTQGIYPPRDPTAQTQRSRGHRCHSHRALQRFPSVAQRKQPQECESQQQAHAALEWIIQFKNKHQLF